MSLNLFQWVALSCLLVLLCYELYSALRGRVHRGFWAIRVAIWIAMGVAIYQPHELTRLAGFVGIRRGADLVSYVTAIVLIATSLYLYARCLRLEKQITQIVRHIALQEARGPDDMPGAA